MKKVGKNGKMTKTMKPNGYPFISAGADLETENDTMVVFSSRKKIQVETCLELQDSDWKWKKPTFKNALRYTEICGNC